MNYAETYPLNVTPQGDTIKEAVQKNRSEILNLVSTLNAQPSGAVGGSRQRILYGATLNGSWNFLSSDGLVVILDGSITPLIYSMADGCTESGNVDYVGSITKRVSAWTIPANNTSYLYMDRSDSGAITYGSTTIEPVEQDSAPEATADDAGLCWFSTLTNQMFTWTGTAWQHVVRLFVGTAVTDGTTVTSITYKEYPQQLAPSLLAKLKAMDDAKLKAMDDGATKNENCVAGVTIGDVTVNANGRQDIFTLVASGMITLTADADNRQITIGTPTLDEIRAQAMLDAHPVGSIYESTVSTSPADLFGGTWEAMEAGRVLVSAGTASTGTVYAAGAKAGEETHKLTISESPSHNHTRGSMNIKGTYTTPRLGAGWSQKTSGALYNAGTTGEKAADEMGGDGKAVIIGFDASRNWTGTTSSSGGNGAHNNMQPYEVIHRWKRTA